MLIVLCGFNFLFSDALHPPKGRRLKGMCLWFEQQALEEVFVVLCQSHRPSVVSGEEGFWPADVLVIRVGDCGWLWILYE